MAEEKEEVQPSLYMNEIETARNDHITGLGSLRGSSKLSKDAKIKAALSEHNIRCQRGLLQEDYVTPLSWYCPVIGQIHDIFANLRSQAVCREDVIAARELCVKMPEFYNDENDRLDEFLRIVRPSLAIHKSEPQAGNYGFRPNKGPDGWIEHGEDHALVLQFECKKEVGSSGDPVMQSVLDYAKTVPMRMSRNQAQPLPTLLLTLSGNTATLHVAATIDVVTVEPLCAGFLYQGSTMEEFRKVAQFLAAIRQSIELLQNFYDSPGQEFPAVPYPRECTIDGDPTSFQFIDRIPRKTLFQVRVTDKKSLFYGRLLGVKFVRRYGREVHELLANHDMAPALYDVVDLPGDWKMIVMDWVIDKKVPATVEKNGERVPTFLLARLNHTEKRALIAQFKQVLKILRDNGFVHGDLRDTNILVTRSPALRVHIVDFDWAGSDGHVRYPWHINWDNFSWLEQDEIVEKPIVHQHDIAAIKEFVSAWIRPTPDPELDAGEEAVEDDEGADGASAMGEETTPVATQNH